jgi:hypothetical protein
MGPVVSRLEDEFSARVYFRRYVLDKLPVGTPGHQEAFSLARDVGLELTPTYLVVRADGSIHAQFRGITSYLSLREALDDVTRPLQRSTTGP